MTKYRAWCKKDNCFYYSDDMLHFHNGCFCNDIKNSSFNIEDLELNAEYCDKIKSAEIYENDFVECKMSNGDLYQTQVVKHRFGGLILKENKTFFKDHVSLVAVTRIIGNIHQGIINQ